MRPFQPTLRTRLTVVYGGLFVLGGIVLLVVTYSFVASTEPSGPAMGEVPQEHIVEEGPGVAGDALDHAVVETWQEVLGEIRNLGPLALGLVSLGTIALGWFIAGRMLRPLHRITEVAAGIAEAPAADRRLHERIKVAGPRDEIRELSETFNRMLERLDQSFDGQRMFIANASHELTTPLTVTRALLEVAVHRQGASVEVRQLGETLLEVNARHERLIESLLLLTRAEQQLTERSYVDLADVAGYVADEIPTEGVEVTLDCEPAPTMGQPVLLERLVSNLVENAARYNLDADGWVRIATCVDADDRAVLTVSNSGPTIRQYDVANLLEPFRRLDTDRLATASKGAGLGLSIVRAITKAHGGETTAEARPGGGLIVRTVLPSAPGRGTKPPLIDPVRST